MNKENKWTIEALDEMVDLMKELQVQVEELNGRIDGIKYTLKEELEARGVEELKTNKYKISNKAVVSNRFDTKRFKKEHEKLYEEYLKTSENKRFLVK